MTIFIHGFGSSGMSNNAKLIRDYFKEKNLPYIAPSLSYIPELAVTTLEELIASYDKVNLIGESLGGYYALYLAHKYQLKAVLINPSIYPEETLKRHIKDSATAHYDGSHFVWRKRHLKMLEAYKVKDKVMDANYFLLLQKGDTVLDYREAVDRLPNASMVIEEGGSHLFEGIERYFEKISKFHGKMIYG